MEAPEGFIGSGALRMGLIAPDGSRLGLALTGNATKFEIKPEVETKDLISNQHATFGQTLASVNIPKPTTIAVAVNQPNRDVFTAAFMGELETILAETGTVTDEVHFAPEPGKSISLEYRNISSLTATRVDGEEASAWAATQAALEGEFVVPSTANDHFYKCTVAGTTGGTEPATWPTDGSTVTDDTVTWQDMGLIVTVLNTHYTLGVDGLRLGLVTTVEDSGIIQGERLSFDYGYSGKAGYQIKGAVQPSIKVEFFLDGVNFNTGRPALVTAFEAMVTPSSPFDFLNGDWNTIELVGTLITPEGKDHPYLVERPEA